MFLTQLFCYPLKSGRAQSLNAAQFTPLGLLGDRRLVVVDATARFVSIRNYAKLSLVDCQLDEHICTLKAPGMEPVSISLVSDNREQISVWRSTINARRLSALADEWLSRYLGGQFYLCFYDEYSSREVSRRPDHQVSFADSCPVLVISEQSLQALNDYTGRVDQMLQFRPNLVVNADQPFAEESWQKIRIGNVELEAVKPCSRCQIICVDPNTAVADTEGEPLKSLSQFHRTEAGDVTFGQYFVVTAQGRMGLNDAIEVLEKRTPSTYRMVVDKPVTANAKRHSVLFDQAGVSTQGSEQQTILEIAEDAGVDLPSSCRSGSCGTCRVKLIKGQVEVGADYALSEQEIEAGYILACSCFARSDLVISQED
ncbi:YcbX family protein [Celerinatantimonas yamalensis]|uniref:MOSC N-terminal beta barrel domain-containing protein n=1 Tax=Celerinatantimonas yamalensis TaxID=559956 RepID=A0ABW9G5J4_9GAMM